MEVTSKPAELERLDRKILQLPGCLPATAFLDDSLRLRNLGFWGCSGFKEIRGFFLGGDFVVHRVWALWVVHSSLHSLAVSGNSDYAAWLLLVASWVSCQLKVIVSQTMLHALSLNRLSGTLQGLPPSSTA